jgi:uncharacterized protein YcfJ
MRYTRYISLGLVVFGIVVGMLIGNYIPFGNGHATLLVGFAGAVLLGMLGYIIDRRIKRGQEIDTGSDAELLVQREKLRSEAEYVLSQRRRGR